MPSGPVALDSSKLDNSAATSSSEIKIEFKESDKGNSTRISRLGGLSLLINMQWSSFTDVIYTRKW